MLGAMSERRGEERRRRARVSLSGEVQGRIHTVQAAPILDISETGALIEVPCSLRPGNVYLLHLQLGDATLVLHSRVARCYVHGIERRGEGETRVRYRTAVQFMNLGDTERAALRDHIGLYAATFDEDFSA
jgi:hypothetical protein